nr:topoisomerase DNA-binding C4 zinc finger domain-containing protein [Gemmobacter aquaticus]
MFLRRRCGASYPTCPECEDGWLVERSGSFGKFLGCVRYPTCTGKAKKSRVYALPMRSCGAERVPEARPAE